MGSTWPYCFSLDCLTMNLFVNLLHVADLKAVSPGGMLTITQLSPALPSCSSQGDEALAPRTFGADGSAEVSSLPLLIAFL